MNVLKIKGNAGLLRHLGVVWMATLLAGGCAGGGTETTIEKSVDFEEYGSCQHHDGAPGVCVDARLCGGRLTYDSSAAAPCDVDPTFIACCTPNDSNRWIELYPRGVTLPRPVSYQEAVRLPFNPAAEGLGVVGRVEVELLVRHPWRGDLRVVLEHENDTLFPDQDVLLDRPDGGLDSDDDIDETFYLAGRGQPIGGPWLLTIEDDSYDDHGTVVRAILRILPRD